MFQTLLFVAFICMVGCYILLILNYYRQLLGSTDNKEILIWYTINTIGKVSKGFDEPEGYPKERIVKIIILY